MSASNVDERDLVTLKEEYKKVCAEYDAKYKALQANKGKDDPALRTEVRVLAQKALGLAKAIEGKAKDFIDKFGVKPEYEATAKSAAEAANKWMDRAKKLGSPISGIPTTTFEDVAGLKEVKEAICNYLFALQHVDAAKAYNISTNVGMLLYGPPGTGKTMIARAIANKLGVRFFVITPSDIFGAYVGDAERNIRDIFAELRACTDGAVLLIDECESVFGSRDKDSSRTSLGVANELLQEMNGATDKAEGDRRVILGATNRPWDIDPAYLRHKRFSMQFYIELPEPEAVSAILDNELKKLSSKETGERYYDDDLKDYMYNVFTSPKYKGKVSCADICGIMEKCAYEAMQDYSVEVRRKEALGDKSPTPFVKVGRTHFDAIMKDFTPSVTEENLKVYIDYNESRQKSIK